MQCSLPGPPNSPQELAINGEVWQAVSMGNRDRGNREKKKPKKTTPKLPPPRRDAHVIPSPSVPKTNGNS